MIRDIHANALKRKGPTLFAIGILAVSLLASACTKGGSLSETTASSVVGASITVDKVYPSSDGESWTPIVSSNRFYVKGLALSMGGVCSRGVSSIRVNEGSGNYTETATCLIDGTWTFSKTYATGQQGDKTLTIAAYDESGLPITGATTTVDVRIDDTAPAAPVITTPGASPFVVNSNVSTFTIIGTCTCVADSTVKLTGPGGVEITPSGNNWSYQASLPGDSATFTFYAWDLAGNQSAGQTQVINRNPTLRYAGTYPGMMQTDSGTNYKLDSTIFFLPSKQTDSGTSYQLLTGFNSMINEEGHK